MLTVAIVAILAGLYALIKAKDNFSRLTNTFVYVLSAGLVAFLLIVFISEISGFAAKDVVVEDTNVELVATSTTAGTEGSFFLIAGTIDQEFYYLYYWKDGSGGIHFDKIKMDRAIVHEVNDTVPRLVVTHDVKTHEAPFNALLMDVNALFPVYHFYVPVGSVSKTFDMSLP